MGLGIKSLSFPWRLDIWISKQDTGYSGYKKVSDPEPEVQNSTFSKKISFDFCISLDYLFFELLTRECSSEKKLKNMKKWFFEYVFWSFFSQKLEGTWTTGSNYMNTDPFRIRNTHINIPSFLLPPPASICGYTHTEPPNDNFCVLSLPTDLSLGLGPPVRCGLSLTPAFYLFLHIWWAM